MNIRSIKHLRFAAPLVVCAAGLAFATFGASAAPTSLSLHGTFTISAPGTNSIQGTTVTMKDLLDKATSTYVADFKFAGSTTLGTVTVTGKCTSGKTVNFTLTGTAKPLELYVAHIYAGQANFTNLVQGAGTVGKTSTSITTTVGSVALSNIGADGKGQTTIATYIKETGATVSGQSTC